MCETYQDFIHLWYQVNLSFALNCSSGRAFQNARIGKGKYVYLLHTYIHKSQECVCVCEYIFWLALLRSIIHEFLLQHSQ